MIKDSYGNALIPYLVDHYQYLYWIDFRYYKGSIYDLVAEKEHQRCPCTATDLQYWRQRRAEEIAGAGRTIIHNDRTRPGVEAPGRVFCEEGGCRGKAGAPPPP